MSGPTPIRSHHNKHLCHERHWLHKCKSIKAIWNRSRIKTWETMSFLTAHDSTRKDLSVYIFSHGCGGILSTQYGAIHFSKQLSEFCKFTIIPIYENCSENCKADYLSKVGCCGSKEDNIPKELSCPRDRPKCRFYHEQAKVLGKCFKENPNDIEGIPQFNQDTPHHCEFATANRSGFINPNTQITDNDTMFNEYTISMARNENNQLYESDTYSHIHKHV